MTLATPQEVINRTGIMKHAEYEDVAAIDNAPGFYAFRR